MSALLFIVTLAYGQERVNRKSGNFSTSKLGELNSAKGWMLNEDEQWDSLLNTIPVCMRSDLGLLKYERTGLGVDNFKQFQIREFAYNDSTYMAIIKKHRFGTYQYQNIKEGWNEYETYKTYIVSKSDFDKLSDIKNSSKNLIEMDIIDVLFSNYESTELPALKAMAIKFKPENRGDKLIFQIAPYKEKEIVQFIIFELSKYGSPNVINPHRIKDEYGYKSIEVMGTEQLFDHCYYETSYQNFNRFIKLE